MWTLSTSVLSASNLSGIKHSNKQSKQQSTGWPWGQATDLKHTVRVCLTRGRTSCMPTFLTSNGLVLVTCKYVRHELADAVRTISHVWHSVVCCSLQVTCNSLCFKRYNTALTNPVTQLFSSHDLRYALHKTEASLKQNNNQIKQYECMKLWMFETEFWGKESVECKGQDEHGQCWLDHQTKNIH